MSISFNEIPADNLVPMFMSEFDNTRAFKSGAMPWKNIIIGQPTTTAEIKLSQMLSNESADALYGPGSQLALAIRAYRKNNKTVELWALPTLDASGSAKATGKIVVSFTSGTVAPTSGFISLTLAGQSVNVNVSAGDSPTEIHAAIASAITLKENLPFTAVGAETGATLTAKNAGGYGNSLSIESCFAEGQTLPTGIIVTITAMTGGGADPSYEDAGINGIIAGQWFNIMGLCTTDAANISYMKDVLDERWKAVDQKTGVLFYTINGSFGAYSTAGDALNSQVELFFAMVKSPTPFSEQMAAVVGTVAPISLNDPAVPLTNWVVKGIVAPKLSDRLTLEENNALLKKGVALLVADDSGNVWLKRMVTTYKRTASGASDTSYQQLEKVFTLTFLRWDWNNYLAGRYPHAKLGNDGDDYGPGQTIMTEKLAKAEILGRFQYWLSKGLVQDYDGFKKAVVTQRDPDDSTAMMWLVPADLMDQFLIGKTKFQFS